MTEVLLFHHARGLPQGVRAFADDLRASGHIVHTPDLFDGPTFQSIDEDLAYIGEIGFDEMRERGIRVARNCLPSSSTLGSRRCAAGADACTDTARSPRLFYSCLPISGEWAFGPWPNGVAVQIHGMDNDPIFVGEGDIDAPRGIVEKVEDAEHFLYPGDQHYFADSSLPSYDADAAALLTIRVPEFLDRV